MSISFGGALACSGGQENASRLAPDMAFVAHTDQGFQASGAIAPRSIWLIVGVIILSATALTTPSSHAKEALERHANKSQLPAFAIDSTEVSIKQFEAFVQATGTTTRAELEGGGFEFLAGWERIPGTSWRHPNRPGETHSDWPAVHVTFAEAQSYCRWAGGRLPTHAEWLSAAFTEQRAKPSPPFESGRTYPWPTGDSPEGANTSGSDPWPRAAPVGVTIKGVNGLFDMGANVWEWTLTASGETRQTVGGSWWYPSGQMRASVQAFKPSDFYAVYIGFRCIYPHSKQ